MAHIEMRTQGPEAQEPAPGVDQHHHQAPTTHPRTRSHASRPRQRSSGATPVHQLVTIRHLEEPQTAPLLLFPTKTRSTYLLGLGAEAELEAEAGDQTRLGAANV